jgi:CxxC-x17-CxxC domain-containing protein
MGDFKKKARKSEGRRDRKESSDRPARSGGRFSSRGFSDRAPSRSEGRSDRRGGTDRGRPSTKFSRDAPRRNDRRGSSGGRDRPEMHQVTCDKCHKQCEVPFKPTSSKPVLCSECFGKSGNSRSGGGLDQINDKLDKILRALDL